jgi:hypothetical protein
MMRPIALIVALGFLVCLVTQPADVRGCAIAPRAGDRVDLADETALIIWDDTADVEHFVRQATFLGSPSDFGFLVPTPSRPQVASVDPSVFQDLARITEPRTEHRIETALNLGCSAKPAVSTEMISTGTLPEGVEILEQKQLGNLEAAVLAFRADKTRKVEDTADELLSWLGSRGYAVRPDLTDWLAPYIEKSWMITAFKIAAPPGSDPSDKKGPVAVKSVAVRLSFKTDRPFFPYREPAAQRNAPAPGSPRSLRVFVVARERMAGRIGAATTWPAQTVWADAVGESERIALLEKLHLPHETAFGKWWLTEFEDRSSPRPGTDELYFERSMDRGAVARPPIVLTTYRTPWWAGPLAIILLLLLGGAGLVMIRRFTRRDEAADAQPPFVRPDESGPKASDGGPRSEPRRWS